MFTKNQNIPDKNKESYCKGAADMAIPGGEGLSVWKLASCRNPIIIKTGENIYIFFFCLIHIFGHTQVPDEGDIFISLSKIGWKACQKVQQEFQI